MNEETKILMYFVEEESKVIKDLSEYLNSLSKEDLNDKARYYYIVGYGHMKKNELVDSIYENMTNVDKLILIVKRLFNIEYSFLRKLMNNNGTIVTSNISRKEYSILESLGILYIYRKDNKFYVSLRKEVYALLKNIDINSYKKLVDCNTKMYELLKAMTELYGVVHIDDLYNMYDKYYGDASDAMDAMLFDVRGYMISYVYVDEELHFVNNVLVEDDFEDLICSVVGRQKEIVRKNISFKELLKYGQDDYYEEDSYRIILRNQLIKLGLNKDVVDYVIYDIIMSFNLDEKVNETLSILEEYDLELEELQMELIIDNLVAVHNNTGLWMNNGWTPAEIRKNIENK